MDAGATHIAGEVTLGRADMVRAILAHPLFKYRWPYLACVGLFVAINLAMGGPGSFVFERLAPLFAPTPILAAFFFAGPYFFARRSLAAMSDPTVRYDLSEQAIAIARKGACVTLSWDQFASFRDEASVFLVRTRSGSLQVIPKRAFSPDGLAWLREKLGREIPPHKKLVSRGARWFLLWLALVFLFVVAWQFLAH